MSWPKIFKKSFWSVFSYSTKQQTISLSDCDKKWILYDSWWWPSQWLTEKLQSTSQSPRLAPKRSWSLFGGLLPVWSTTAFWIPVKPLHLRSMLSKLMRCTANCNTCSQLWSTERAQFFPMTIPNSMSRNQRFKSWTNWALKFHLSSHVHLTSRQPTIISSGILTTFCRENTFTTARCRKCFPRVHWIPRHGFLCYRNKQTYFSLAKMCWL